MRLSSISKHRVKQDRENWARLGSAIRDARVNAGMTQTQLGFPLTRSFVSAVEHGLAVPSVPALLMMATKLGLTPGQLLDHMEWTSLDTYTGTHATDKPAATGSE